MGIMASSKGPWQAKKYREAEFIHELASLLRNNGEDLLSGSSKLTLTANSLVMLHHSFETVTDENCMTSFEVLPTGGLQQQGDLQFLYDFVQKTLALKVLHGPETLQGTINVGVFRALRTLELKKTPLHMVYGLQRLRQKLSTLICSRCITNLQKLLESCGGDDATALYWPELKELYLSFNDIQHIDNSFRLLPALTVLDLSHNYITEVKDSLQDLSELVVMNFGFNMLEKIPRFSHAASTQLRTLDLRNNHLDDLEGLGELKNLKELDLANNGLSQHSTLEPLRQLARLQLLLLEGNPLSYHKKHRKLTAARINPMAGKGLVLDGYILTKSEYKYCSSVVPLLISESVVSTPAATSGGEDFLESLDMVGESSIVHQRASPIRKKKTKKSGKSGRRARRALITDQETTGEDNDGFESASTSAATTPYGSINSAQPILREKLETMRSQLGPDWLQGLEIAQKTNRSEAKIETEPSPVNQTPGEPIKEQATCNGGHDSSDLKENDFQSLPGSPKLFEESIDVKDSAQNEIEYPQKTISPNNEKDTEKSSKKSKKEKSPQTEPVLQKNGIHKSEENIYSLNKQKSEELDNKDYGVESEPFIVSLVGDGESDTEFLVTVTDRYLVEKNLDGHVTEALDLKCLQKIEQEGSTGVKLLFDYVRKDKRERLYSMEDTENLENFMSLVQPFEIQMASNPSLKVVMQCLKCNNSFQKLEGLSHVRSTNELMSREILSNNSKDSVTCPSCRSSLVIGLDEKKIGEKQGSNFTTPIGSLNNTSNFNMSPLATSSAVQSPTKPMDSPNQKLINRIHKESSVISDGSFKSTTDIQTPPQGSSFHSTCTWSIGSPPGDSLDGGTPKVTSSNTVIEKNNTNDWICDIKNNVSPDKETKKEHEKVPNKTVEKKKIENETVINSEKENILEIHQDKPQRMRQESGGSDIIVLPSQSSSSRKSVDTTSSDITRLSNPSQSSIAVLDSENSSVFLDALQGDEEKNKTPVYARSISEVVEKLEKEKQEKTPTTLKAKLSPSSSKDDSLDLTPCGSLSNKTLSSMVSSMYEASITDSSDTGGGASVLSANHIEPSTSIPNDFLDSASKKGSQSSVSIDKIDDGFDSPKGPETSLPAQEASRITQHSSEASDGLKYNFTDFSQIDHRLKLYLSMHVFKGENEEFSMLLKCGMVMHGKPQVFDGILAVSTEKIYILKITGEERADKPEKWLKCSQSHAIVDVHNVDIGLGNQTVRLDFGSDTSCVTLLLLDEKRCKQWMRQFTALVKSTAMDSKSQLQGISKSDPDTFKSLEEQVLLASSGDQDISEIDTHLVKYIMAYIKEKENCSLISVVVTRSHICLAKEDLSLFTPRSAVFEKGGKIEQFEPKGKQNILNITSVDIFENFPNELIINFTDEDTGESSSWSLTFETADSAQSLLDALKTPWQEAFAVDLQVNVLVR